MGVINTETVEIDMSLDREISAVKPPGDLRAHFGRRAFDVFRCEGNDKSGSIFDEFLKLTQGFIIFKFKIFIRILMFKSCLAWDGQI